MSSHDFRTPRLFLTADLSAGVEIEIDRNRANYLQNVMRLRDGDAVLVFNGRGGEWRAQLTGQKRGRRLVVQARTRAQTDEGNLVYAFAPLKHARLDYMVQKSVEMGTAILAPVVTQHTQVTRVNLDRMRANVIEAAEQCGVLAVPRVEAPLKFDRWLEALPGDRVVVFCDEEAKIADPFGALAGAPDGPTVLLVGPEGGFAEAERRALLSRGRVVQLSLGPRILRADTAAVAALALVQAVRGDWR
jgi:16S rRNA (uracil1498-N3)-methyltransferase